jgi:hypothetical protein
MRMPELYDYNPFTGVTKFFDEDSFGDVHIRSEMDVEPALNRAKQIRNERSVDHQIKADDYMCLVAMIPPIVEMQLLKKGLRLSRTADLPKIEREIELNYPYCKVSDKKLWRPT